MEDWERTLPPAVAAALAPHQRRAVGNRTRRQILRQLSGSASPKTPSDLALAIPGASISVISYHVLVLEECGCVSLSIALADEVGQGQGVSSAEADSGPLREALDATPKLDGLDG